MKKYILKLSAIAFLLFLIACNSKKETTSDAKADTSSVVQSNTPPVAEAPVATDINVQLSDINNKLKAAGIASFEKKWIMLSRDTENSEEYYISEACGFNNPEIKLIYDESNYCYILNEMWGQDSFDNLVVDYKETPTAYEFTLKNYNESDLSKSMQESSRKLIFTKISAKAQIVNLLIDKTSNFFIPEKNKKQYAIQKEDCD